MVDVSQKNETERFALASGIISVSQAVMDAIQKDQVPKGNVLATARIAGIMAAKKLMNSFLFVIHFCFQKLQ